MTGSADGNLPASTQPSDPLIGTPERDSAREALEAHLTAERLDPAEYERREQAAQLATTQSELLRLFADLPAPHPTLPATTATHAEPVDEATALVFFGGIVTLVLGLPVTVVIGLLYGTWWLLAVPVAITVAMTYVEYIRAARQQPGHGGNSRCPKCAEL